MKDEINTIAGEIEQEVRRAVQLHRGICSLHEAKAIIEEELDEFWDEVKVNPKKLSEVDRGQGLVVHRRRQDGGGRAEIRRRGEG